MSGNVHLSERPNYSQTEFCYLFVEYLIELGVKHFVFSPGARNSPLVLALLSRAFFIKNNKNKSSERKYTIHSHYDERGSGFFALGLLKGIQQEPLNSSSNAIGEKVVLITTSGSAVSNLLPTLSEARYSNKSLIVITADRPLELHHLGVNQTMQQNILISQIEHYCDFDPEVYGLFSKPFSYRPLFSRLNQAISYLNRGTVQINLIFREPYLKPYVPSLIGDKSINFFTEVNNTLSLEMSIFFKKYLSDVLAEGKWGILIVGELVQNLDKTIIQDAINCFKKMGWLVIIDPLSGLTHNNDLPYYDIFFKWLVQSNKSLIKPNTVIHLGGRLIAKWWFNWLVKLNSEEEFNYIHIASSSQMRYDPAEVVRFKFSLSPLVFCQWIVEQPLVDNVANNVVEVIISNLLDFKQNYLFERFSELKVWSLLERYFQKKINQCKEKNKKATFNNRFRVFVGNSMAIRDYCNQVYLIHDSNDTTSIPIFDFYANRGLSGIDGLVATSIGLAISRDNKEEFSPKRTQQGTMLFHSVMGDLAFLHDINSLALLRELNQVKVIFFIINNREGTIFKQIGLGEELKNVVNEPNSTTLMNPASKFYYQHSFEFKAAAELFGLTYCKVNNQEELATSLDEINRLDESNKISNHYLIEIMSDSKQNLSEHQLFSQAFDQHLNSINLDI